MDIVNHLRIHLLTASGILLASLWASRLLESGSVTTLTGVAGIAGLLFGSSIYVGLVFGVGGGLVVLILNETIEDYIDDVRTRRRRVVERLGDGQYG